MTIYRYGDERQNRSPPKEKKKKGNCGEGNGRDGYIE